MYFPLFQLVTTLGWLLLGLLLFLLVPPPAQCDAVRAWHEDWRFYFFAPAVVAVVVSYAITANVRVQLTLVRVFGRISSRRAVRHTLPYVASVLPWLVANVFVLVAVFTVPEECTTHAFRVALVSLSIPYFIFVAITVRVEL